MKKKQLLLLIGMLAFLTVIMTHLQPSEEERYLNHIKKISRVIGLDGPEKSFFRDAQMTMSPKTGKIYSEKIKEFFGSRIGDGSRIGEKAEVADFEWEQINTDIAGRVRSFMVDPNDPGKLWAGATTGGLWYNPDFRNNAAWIPVSDDWESMSIACIAYDPNDTQTFYVGTGESFTSVNIYRESSSSGVGIYKTIDGGVTWSLLSSTEEFDYVNDIIVRDEEGQSIVYAGVASGTYQGNVFSSAPSDGLYRSVDEGITWSQVLPMIEGESVSYAVSDIELTSSGDLFVGTMRNLALDGAGIILSSSDGKFWEVEDRYVALIKSYFDDVFPGRVRLASNGDVVYAVVTGGFKNSFNQIRDSPNFTKIMRYEAGTWANIEDPPNFWASIPWHAMAIAVDPNNSDRIVIGGLNALALSNAKSSGSLNWVEVSDWSSMFYFSDYLIPYFGLQDQDADSIINHFIHADIHAIDFLGDSSDEILFSNDGGLHYSSDFSKSFELLSGDRLNEYASFNHINNSFATTQYYTVALHPDAGNNEVIAGSQDNSTHTSEDGSITYEHLIGEGDGAYGFFDSDDPQLRITSSQVNNYNIWIGNNGYFKGSASGTFINPADYDDKSNFLFANESTQADFEALITPDPTTLDLLLILNINPYLNKQSTFSRDTLSFQSLGTGTQTAFSVVKVSPHGLNEDPTLLLGNQSGDVYIARRVLEGTPEVEKIDNDQLPVGYISSIDIGDTENDILVTFSNYDTESVWYSSNGGQDWQNLERNLPDIPVRYGIFNPLDDQKILLATEVGVWGLENLMEESTEWVFYNKNFPNVRVDMIKARGIDSVIVAATHGRGLFLGKFNQGEKIDEPLEVIDEMNSRSVYPNPTGGVVNFDFDVKVVQIFSLSGKLLQERSIKNNQMDLSTLRRGLYLIRTKDAKLRESSFRVFKQ